MVSPVRRPAPSRPAAPGPRQPFGRAITADGKARDLFAAELDIVAEKTVDIAACGGPRTRKGRNKLRAGRVLAVGGGGEQIQPGGNDESGYAHGNPCP